MITKIDGALLKEMFASGAALLTENREGVDALNVFPVPDGDTGTNMTQTITSAIKEMNARTLNSVADVADAMAKGALRGARGNSGVILSQILRGFSRALNGCEEIDKDKLVEMVRQGAKTAYKAVMKPKEGTILTVARVIAEETEKAAPQTDDLAVLFRNIIVSGDAILRRTPEMLPVLKQAGVVDSGGKGLMYVFRGMYAALTGEPVDAKAPDAGTETDAVGEGAEEQASAEELRFGYSVDFIVSHPRPDMREGELVRLRERLERIGENVQAISDMSDIKVHVNTNDPGKALQYALELGELDSIRIANLFEEARQREAKRQAEEEAQRQADKEYGIVAVALGEGLVNIFKDLNVDRIVDGGQTMNPSIQDLAEAVEATHARNVIILPNNTNIILAAQQATELTSRNVVVLPTKSVPMGISAILAFNPDASLEENAEAMRQAAENVHTASVTYAVRDTVYDNHEIHAHDIMGMIDNKLEVLGQDVVQVAADCVEHMYNEDASLITIYYGEDTPQEQAEALGAQFEEKYPDCDIEIQMGGQPLYYYLIAVE